MDVQHVEGGFEIKASNIALTASVPGADEAAIRETAEKAHRSCPLSKALGSVGTRELEVTIA